MSLTWNRRSLFLMSAVAAVALMGAACSDDNGDGDTTPTTNPPASATIDTTASASPTAEMTATPEAVVLSGMVMAVADSGVAGEVILTEVDGKTAVTVTVTGLSEGGHANHLHAGSCAATGAVSHPLDELIADASGAATATTVLDVAIADVAAGHYYTVHAGDDEAVGDAVGCADYAQQM
ncbi:MAG: hypothetical protein O2798_11715 [Chloroflexi bacterium]|nr:hypothetical protein [Chloroflexota bacterium]MDA1241489.1 hypothetical protein [Chloroflexota bacterium]